MIATNLALKLVQAGVSSVLAGLVVWLMLTAAAPNLALQRSGRDGRFAYTLAATAVRKRTLTPSVENQQDRDADGRLLVVHSTRQQEIDGNDSGGLAPRLSWDLGHSQDREQTLTWQSYLGANRIDNRHLSDETSLLGAPTQYPHSDARYRARSAVLRSDLNWANDLDGGASVELKLGGNANRRRADFQFDGAGLDGAPAGRHQVASGPREQGLTFSGAWHRPLGPHHTISAGWDGARQ